ncbi:hypothetical protein COY87_01575 [Candidatus Roizmanbacteria bacterium CG_4_10_14_0_8_um_filter_33_9]|uniref:Glycosyltransferase RgtA/B/C/D-like domain-containing protein n=1 Tax=Candidatus Roizmanbacteria bacterium CG_4_10_14_0_8_um_filter_33_9 TaxID=1974826 RepID=A0A2M7QJ38_9BACT|nr:MAG: hypothetical protein COY87_01575 [Candidatus Roizmanbacteria bacterium CG_4_10_14_0_8_um_filter_33_9]
MKNNDFKLTKHIFLILFLIFFFLFNAYQIIKNTSPFFDWDESIYAQVGKEMIQKKSFFVPLWQGRAWLDKPPLPSLVYGLTQLIPIKPEISTRLITLLLSCITLILLYLFTFHNIKKILPSLLTVIITAFIPIFLQRTQALNVDVFLLLGWLGYVLYHDRFWISTLFLLVAVLSKSLLGFYPIGIFVLFHTYQLLTKQINQGKFIHLIKRLLYQCFIASVWFIVMYLFYGQEFIRYHFIESHFKRVTASIEQHFGQRTFYIDIIIDQLKWLIIPGIVSGIILTYTYIKNKNMKQYLFTLFFIPWFIFLNLTKTKIAWYIYPVLPQFALLSSYPLTFFKNKLINTVYFIGALFILFNYINPFSGILTSSYSQLEDHHRIATNAKVNKCEKLFVLVGDNTRTSYATLKSMNLVISTTTWWGNHPSIAYYSQAKTTFIYNTKQAIDKYINLNNKSCLIIEKNDLSLFPPISKARIVSTNNKTYILFKGK